MMRWDTCKEWGRKLWANLTGINDTPLRISAGFGLGVFMGIFPGVGPIASLVVAACLRINKAAALAGCLITNTWIGFVTFILVAKVGSRVTGTSWERIAEAGRALVADFHWKNLFQLSVGDVLMPLMIGYLIVGLLCGLVAGAAVWAVLIIRAKSRAAAQGKIDKDCQR